MLYLVPNVPCPQITLPVPTAPHGASAPPAPNPACQLGRALAVADPPPASVLCNLAPLLELPEQTWLNWLLKPLFCQQGQQALLDSPFTAEKALTVSTFGCIGGSCCPASMVLARPQMLLGLLSHCPPPSPQSPAAF